MRQVQEAAAAAAVAAEQQAPPGPGRDQKISLAILRYLKTNQDILKTSRLN